MTGTGDLPEILSFHDEMQAGNTARQSRGKDGHEDAIFCYQAAYELAETDDERAEALQAEGVSWRVIGELRSADEALQTALSRASSGSNAALIGRIQRDLGEVYHEKALEQFERGTKDLAEESYREAEELFTESIRNFQTVGDVVEEDTTAGFWGLMMYEWGHRDSARRQLRTCDQFLRHAKNPNLVYEFNNLVRLMRVVWFVERPRYLPRALKLTTKGSANEGDRKRVYAALLGNRFYRFAMQRVRGK